MTGHKSVDSNMFDLSDLTTALEIFRCYKCLHLYSWLECHDFNPDTSTINIFVRKENTHYVHKMFLSQISAMTKC